MNKVIGAYEVVDHRWDGSQYFQGCGTHGTSFTHVYTGCGTSQKDAANDALEQIAGSAEFYLPDALDEQITNGYDDETTEEGEAWYYYFSIRVRSIDDCEIVYIDGKLQVVMA